MIEVGTGICKDIKEARTDIVNLRAILSGLVRNQGLEIVAAGTHPFSHWQDQKIFENTRYELMVEENQMIARSLLTFGLHVHVGVADPRARKCQRVTLFVNLWSSSTMSLTTLIRGKR
jgi:carboxylate-amine ligase